MCVCVCVCVQVWVHSDRKLFLTSSVPRILWDWIPPLFNNVTLSSTFTSTLCTYTCKGNWIIQFVFTLLYFTLFDCFHIFYLNHIESLLPLVASTRVNHNFKCLFNCFPSITSRCALHHVLLSLSFSSCAAAALMNWQGFPLTALFSGNLLRVARPVWEALRAWEQEKQWQADIFK